MQTKSHKPSYKQSSQIKIAVFSTSTVNFNSPSVKKQLDEVKKEVKSVLEGANIDPQTLSRNFTV